MSDQSWRDHKKAAPVVIPLKPDAQGRVPLDDTMSDAIGVGAGAPLWRHYARSPYFKFPSVAHLANSYLGQKLVIVGGGMSARRTVAKYRTMSKATRGVCIAAPNKSHDWLVKQGIIPDFGVLVDPRPHVVGYIRPRKDVLYLLGLSLADEVFEKFLKAGAAFATWIGVNHPDDEKTVVGLYPPEKGYAHAFVTGLSTVGFRMVTMGSLLGFTDFELHGFDSCYAPFRTNAELAAAYHKANCITDQEPIAGLYAYAKPESEYEMRDTTFEAEDGSTFRFMGNNNMTVQARNYADFLIRPNRWKVDGVYLRQDVKVAGDGIIPWMAYKAGRHLDMTAMERKYGYIKDFDYRCVEPVTAETEARLREIEREAVAQQKKTSRTPIEFDLPDAGAVRLSAANLHPPVVHT